MAVALKKRSPNRAVTPNRSVVALFVCWLVGWCWLVVVCCLLFVVCCLLFPAIPSNLRQTRCRAMSKNIFAEPRHRVVAARGGVLQNILTKTP